MTRTALLRPIALLLAVLAASCGPATVRPASYSDPTTPCPGGQNRWNLEILDQRAERVGEEKMTAAIRNGIQSSFTGCQWSASPQAGVGTISIEVHRFASVHDAESWEAAVEWSVRATSAAGRTLTEFEANEEVSRLNYRGSDNEKESLTQAFQASLERTIKGLRAMPSLSGSRAFPAIDADRPREGTAPSFDAPRQGGA
jgi:hypothetical protein